MGELQPHPVRETIPPSNQRATRSNASTDSPEPFRLSPTWDIGIPFSVAVIPACLFKLLGLVIEGLDKPAAQPSTWVFIVIMILQTLGIIAMAFVILTRFERGFQQLALRTNGSPAIWRKLILFLAIVLVLLVDILTNVAAAFAGAGPLVVLAGPIFIGYIACVRIAFAGL